MICTTSKNPQGHWRAGVFHSPKGSEWPDDRFSADELELLEGDPRLSVEWLDGDPGTVAERPPAGPSGEDAEYLERKADLDAREQELAAREQEAAAKEQELATREQIVAAIKADPDVRLALLRGAARKVIEGKMEGDFTKDRKPTTEAIEREAFGFDITAKERDALFEELSAEKG